MKLVRPQQFAQKVRVWLKTVPTQSKFRTMTTMPIQHADTKFNTLDTHSIYFIFRSGGILTEYSITARYSVIMSVIFYRTMLFEFKKYM